MKKPFFVLLVIVIFLFSTAAVSFADRRHGYPGYNSRYYSSHYGGAVHHRSYPRHSYSHSNYFWTSLGLGVLTGALVGSIFYQPPRPQTVVYTTSPQVIVQSQPVVTWQQSLPTTPPPELVLKQVKIIERIVNIRSGPGLEKTIINQIRQNEAVDVIGAAPEWLYIKTADGRYGWVMTQYTYEIDRPVG